MTPRLHRSTLIAAALTVALAGLAMAEPPQAPPPDAGRHRSLSQLDSNQDGTIDRDEAARHPRLAGGFDRLDRNGDGKLDASERPRWRGHRGHRGGLAQAIRLDTDGDGRISKAEAAGSKLAAGFDQADRNRDGYLVHRELRAAAEQRRNEHAATRRQSREAKFTAADADRDGKLSRAEVETHMPRLARAFAFLDEDRDGFLTRTELQPAPHR